MLELNTDCNLGHRKTCRGIIYLLHPSHFLPCRYVFRKRHANHYVTYTQLCKPVCMNRLNFLGDSIIVPVWGRQASFPFAPTLPYYLEVSRFAIQVLSADSQTRSDGMGSCYLSQLV